MKSITLEKILNVLRTGENEVLLNGSVIRESRQPLERMLDLGQK